MRRELFENSLLVDDQLTACKVQFAERFGARLRGLLFSPPLRLPQALLIRPCNSVHTFWMSYSLDVAFLDREGMVLKIRTDLKPWRASYAGQAHAVLELPAGGAKHWGIRPGRLLSYTHGLPPQL